MSLLASSNDFRASRELNIKINADGVITLISPNCYEILGYKEDEVLNTNISNYLGYSLQDLSAHTDIQIGVSKKNEEMVYFDISFKPLVDNDFKIAEQTCLL